MDSSLTLKLGRNHRVKRRPCGTAAGLRPNAVVGLFILGFRVGLFCVLPVSGRVDSSLHQQLPLDVCLHACVFHTFVTDDIVLRPNWGRVSPTPAWQTLRRSLSSCVFLCATQTCCFSLSFLGPDEEQLPTLAPPSSGFTQVLWSGCTSPSFPHSSHPSLASRLSLLSERRVRREDSIPQCNSVLP